MGKGNDLEYDVHFSFQLKKCPFCIQTKIISVFCMSILSMTISTITGPDLDHQKNVFSHRQGYTFLVRTYHSIHSVLFQRRQLKKTMHKIKCVNIITDH